MQTALGLIPRWFVAIIGILYGSGFLVVSSYADKQFGIPLASADPFKAQYILIGIQFLLLPMSVVLPFSCLLMLFIRRFNKKQEYANPEVFVATRDSYRLANDLLSLAIFIQLPLLFSLLFLFSPPGYFHVKFTPIAWAFFGTVAALLLFGYGPPMIWKHALKGRSQISIWWMLILKLFIALSVVIIDVSALRDLLPSMLESGGSTGGLTYLGFIALITVIATQMGIRLRVLRDSLHRKAVWTGGLCLIATFYFMAAFGFAYGIYPYVPAVRGGGELASQPDIIIQLKPGNGSMDLEGKPIILASKRMKVVQQSATSLFIADPNGRDATQNVSGPCEWRRGLSKPNVFEVPKVEIASIVILNAESRGVVCKK